MPPARRSAVGLVAQAGITSFIQWYDDPKSTPWIAADIFAAAPRELLRSVSLHADAAADPRDGRGDRGAGRRQGRAPARGDPAVLARGRLRGGGRLRPRGRGARTVGCAARGARRRLDPDRRSRRGAAEPDRRARLARSRRGRGARRNDSAALRRRSAPPHRAQARRRRADRRAGLAPRARARPRRPPNRVEDVPSDLPFPEIARRLEPGFGSGHLVLGPPVPALVDASQSARAALGRLRGRARVAPRPAPRRGGRPPSRARPRRRSARQADPRRAHLPSAAGAQRRSRHDTVELPRQRPLARGDGARALRAPEHGPLPAQARVRGHRLGRHGSP